MPRKAWIYISIVLATAAIEALSNYSGVAPVAAQWQAFLVLAVLASAAQVGRVETPAHQMYYATPAFLFAGLILLTPWLFVLLVAVPHLVEWGKERLTNGSHLRSWLHQPFNIAAHLLGGASALWVYEVQYPIGTPVASQSMVVAGITAAITYVLVNRALVGQMLVLTNAITWRESGILSPRNVLTDLVQVSLGFVAAILWTLNPWLILPALSPLALMYRLLHIPRLEQEARVDTKTGLWNAQHFATLFGAEMERARRFERPMAMIMADLDLLREINNRYGHLAGDAVLEGVGHTIRESIREYDIAARFGGEEFVIVLPETSLPEAYAVATRLRRAVEHARFEVESSDEPIQATLSLGISCYPSDASSANSLIHEADVAVYQAKLQGRNCVVCAADVPHFRGLQDSQQSAASPYGAAFRSRSVAPVDAGGSGQERGSTATVVLKQAQQRTIAMPGPARTVPPATSRVPELPSPTVRQYPRGLLNVFIGMIIAGAAAIAIAGSLVEQQIHVAGILLLVALTVIAELLHVDLYGPGTISVSVALAFAAGLVAGVPGVVLVSAAIAFTHFYQRRPPLYKSAFNWATHVLAGLAPVSLKLFYGPLQETSLLTLALPVGIAAVIYYLVDTGLIAAVISMSQGNDILETWKKQFLWVASHYIVLCMVGVFLAIAFVEMGLRGLFVFSVPVMMMRYAQQQYVEKTRGSVQELKRMNQELTQANQEIVRASHSIHQLNDELFHTLAKIIDARDPFTSGHAAQVASYATAIGAELGVSEARLEHLRQAAFLHDVGKIGIKEAVLHKPGRLTDEEYEHIKTHAALGGELLDMSQGLRHLAPFVRHHHERWDGRGYPDRLQEEEIPLEARILAICDAVEAMASDRPYHAALPIQEILVEVRRCAGTQFDPAVVDAFLCVIQREGEELVVNSAEEVAQHVARNLDPARQFLSGWHGPSKAAGMESPVLQPS
jgi:diguanylate cyclase (GGDEF)-like protein